MAQVITVEKKQPPKTTIGNKKNNEDKKPPLFRKMNYILMIVGVLLVAFGYIVLKGGAPESPEEFNPEVFNVRRLVVSPLLILSGLVVEFFAIMYHPKDKNKDKQISEQ